MTRKINDDPKIPAPLIKLDELLPLNNLTWERFESFCLELIKALDDGNITKIHKYGVKGSKQRGIDILLDSKDGMHKVFQSKEYNSFTKSHMDKAIKDATYTADQYTILVSSQVGVSVRDICRKKKKWDVWDAYDICCKIKFDLSPEKARRLINNHFGAPWTEEFLGIRSISPFVIPEDYFSKLTNKNELFNQAWDLVGRKEMIDQLDNFVESSQSVYILEGMGGIGKTKVLKEFSEAFCNKHHDIKLLFLDPEIEVRPEDVRDLELLPHIIVIDDAHRRSDVPSIINLLKQHKRSVKFILSTRPQGTMPLRSTFVQNGYDPSNIEKTKVGRLSLEEAKKLAEQVVGSKNQQLVEDLAKHTKDCPLILVVGGKLIAEKKIPLDLLEQDETFTLVVLERFADICLGKITDNYDSKILRQFVNILAVIQPINPSDEMTLDLLASFLKLDKTDVINILDLLEANEVLLRRGNYVRIIPDVLADHIVSRACLTTSGKPNGFSQKAFSHFKDKHFEEILQNLGELDWRVSRSKKKIDLLGDIWKIIEMDIKKGNNFERSEILKKLNSVAYYQPEQTLKIIEFVINNPSTKPENKAIFKNYGFSHNDCLIKLPPLLQQVGHYLEYLPHCADLLWRLGKEDDRATNQNPDHAMRVLENLAKYDIGKIIEYNRLMLESVKRWLADPKVHQHRHSVFDILDPLLEKSSHSDIYEGNTIIFRPFMVNKENTRPIRNETLDIITEHALKSELPIALRAIGSLSKALSEPTAHFNGTISDEECQKWKDEQLSVLDAYKKVASKRKEPLIHIIIKDDIVWYIKRSRSVEVKEAARKLFDSLSKSFETNLTECLMRPDGKEWLLDDEKYSFEKRQEKNKKFQQFTVRKFAKDYPSTLDGFKKIEEIFKILESCTDHYNSHLFLTELAINYPEYAKQLCDITMKKEKTLLGRQIDFLLYGIDETDHSYSSKFAQKAIAGQEEKILLSAASYYGYRFNVEKATKQDIENIKKLIGNKHPFVRKLAINSIGRIGKKDYILGMKLMSLVQVGKDEQVAEEYIEQLNETYDIDPDSLEEKDIKMILSKLVLVKKIGNHRIEKFLKFVSEKFPELFIDFLLQRVKMGEQRKDHSYEPFGYELHKQISPLKGSPKYKNILRKIRDVACTYKEDNYRYAKLFKVLTGNFNETTLDILSEWIESGDKSKIMGLGALVHQAYHDFAFVNPNFIEKLLNAAKELGEECFNSVKSNLFSGVVCRSKGGTVGQPLPEDIKMRDEASRLMKDFPQGTPTHEFFKDIKEEAEKEIERSAKRDEEMLGD